MADVSNAIEWYGRVFGFEAGVVNPPGDPVPVYAVLKCCRVASGSRGVGGPIEMSRLALTSVLLNRNVGMLELLRAALITGLTGLVHTKDDIWRSYLDARPYTCLTG